MYIVIGIAVLYTAIFLAFLIFFLLTRYTIGYRYLKISLFFLIIALGIIAFSTYPSAGTDLSRYYVEVNLMRELGKTYAFGDSLYKTTPVANALFYLVSLTEANNLLPCISTLILFSLLFYINLRILKELEIPVKYFCLFFVLFLSICSLRAMLTGIRQGLACSVMAVAIYYDFILKKKNIQMLLLYLCSILVHVGVFPILILRILLIFIGKFKCKFLVILWGMTIPGLEFLANSSNEYIQDIYDKMIGYGEIAYPDMRLLVAKTVVFLILVFLVFRIKGKEYGENIENFINFYKVLFYFTIGSYSIPHLYERMITFSMFISLPVIYGGLKSLNYKSRQLFYAFMIFMAIGLLLYWGVDLKTSWRLTAELFN